MMLPVDLLIFCPSVPGTFGVELKRALGLADNSLSGALSRLKDRGVLEPLGRARYRLR